jgi:hypothetical protein
MIICGGNRVEWFVADYAAIFKSIVTIPVHVAFDDAAIKQILQETDGPLPIAPATRSPLLAVLAYPRERAMLWWYLCVPRVLWFNCSQGGGVRGKVRPPVPGATKGMFGSRGRHTNGPFANRHASAGRSYY